MMCMCVCVYNNKACPVLCPIFVVFFFIAKEYLLSEYLTVRFSIQSLLDVLVFYNCSYK